MGRCVAVIPARYGSSRLPGKALMPLAGKPMIQHVYARVQSCRLVDQVFVATDDDRIAEVVAGFGGTAILTSPDHVSGTDRVAEAMGGIQAEWVVNVQGDEPLIDPATIEAVILPLKANLDIPVVTACVRIQDLDTLMSVNAVKVVCASNGNALYFSRWPIPFHRRPGVTVCDYSEFHGGALPLAFKHLGIYGFQRDFLHTFVRMEPTPLEKLEQLEQLRILENGFAIRVVEVFRDSVGVDDQADYRLVRRMIEESPNRLE